MKHPIIKILITAIILIYIYSSFNSDTPSQSFENLHENYTFWHPYAAYQLFQMIDGFEEFEYRTALSTKALGLVKQEDYCQKHWLQVINNPESIFQELNIFTDDDQESVFRDYVIPRIGNDSMPEIEYLDSYLGDVREIRLRMKIGLYWTNTPLHKYQMVGLNFACITQMYNHIPGMLSLQRKDLTLKKFQEYDLEHSVDCFNLELFMPESWRLENRAQCRDFFNLYFDSEYVETRQIEGAQYIRKFGELEEGEGLAIVDEVEEEKLRELYNDGKLCGKVKDFITIQRLIKNPLLIKGHKFELKAYMLIGSANPFMVYYHDGFLKMLLKPYKSDDYSTYFSSRAMINEVVQIFEGGELISGMNEEELAEFEVWNFQEFEKYMVENNLFPEPDWMNNTLRIQLKRACIHLLQAVGEGILKRSQLFELIGLDFILDENLNLWFLESKTTPMYFMENTPKHREETKKMFVDMFEIEMGLLRSRIKRIATWMNQFTSDNKDYFKKGGVLKEFEHNVYKFKQALRNRFEPGFFPSPENGFEMILNEADKTIGKYFGILPPECS